MSRVEIPLTAQTVDPITHVVSAALAATVQVNVRNADGTNGAAATVFTSITGGGTVPGGTITTDSAGRIEGWVDPGQYNLVISGAGITTYTQPWDAGEGALTIYRKVGPHMFVRADALAAATYVLADNTTAPILASNAGAALGVFYFDPADFVASSRTTNFRLRVSLLANATAPTVNFTVGLYPVTAVAGAAATTSITLGAVIVGSTVAFNTPGASSLNQGNSGDFAASVAPAGYYIYGLVVSGASAVGSSQAITTALQMREV